MIKRALEAVAFSGQWGRQMRFICGPRQAGKTTLAKQWLERTNSEGLYYLWDLRQVRSRYKANELFFTEDVLAHRCHPERSEGSPAQGETEIPRYARNDRPLRVVSNHDHAPQDGTLPWVCFDEIHKMPKWKNILKAAVDATGDRFRFIVTGSAKLNLLKRAGDSLAGRYFTFHLFPLILPELIGRTGMDDVPSDARAFIDRQLSAGSAGREALETLLEFSGFPEPFLRQSRAFHAKWAADYIETVIREDIGSLTRIVDREHIYDLYALLPEMAGSPISEASLASHVQVSPVTAKNYLRRLEDFYLGFSVAPYSRNIKRSLLKARKFYLHHWARIANPGARFETFVACQVKARLSLWTDASGVAFELFYVRNKQKQETDFLVVRDGTPWLLVEAKLADARVEAHHAVAAEALGGIPVVQVCLDPGVASMQARDVFRISAERFLG